MNHTRSSFRNRDIISAKDFSKTDLELIFSTANRLSEDTQNFKQSLQDKCVALMFFEPSTRTLMSFQRAIQLLGGSFIGFSDPTKTSIAKGETVYDVVKVVERYKVDCIIVRHPAEQMAEFIAKTTELPVINAGDGANEHPTQAMLDLYTVKKELGSIDGLKIGFLGDLRYARTVNSLVYALANYDVELFFIAPEYLQINDKIIEFLGQKNKQYSKLNNLTNVLKDLDVLYVTRLQKERFPEEVKKISKEPFKLTSETLKGAKPMLKILHPLPRVGEIDEELDNTQYVCYFKQVENGLNVRAALLHLIIGDANV